MTHHLPLPDPQKEAKSTYLCDICPKSNTRKKLACYIMPSDTSEIKVETIPELEVIPENVEDVSAYKSCLPLNPLPVPLMNPKEMVRIVE